MNEKEKVVILKDFRVETLAVAEALKTAGRNYADTLVIDGFEKGIENSFLILEAILMRLLIAQLKEKP